MNRASPLQRRVQASSPRCFSRLCLASCSTRSPPHAPHVLFLSTHLHVLLVEIVPELGCSGSHIHVAILLWPALAGGPECGRDRCSRVRLPLVPRVHHVILPWQTPCESERSVLRMFRFGFWSVSLLGGLLPLRSFRPRVLCVDEAVLDFVRGPFDETFRDPFSMLFVTTVITSNTL